MNVGTIDIYKPSWVYIYLYGWYTIHNHVAMVCFVALKELVDESDTQIRKCAESGTRLVIVLDSIDQLTKNDVAFNLSWYVSLVTLTLTLTRLYY